MCILHVRDIDTWMSEPIHMRDREDGTLRKAQTTLGSSCKDGKTRILFLILI
jgi:hypothetical protein